MRLSKIIIYFLLLNIKIGEAPKNFFIILKGKASILIPKTYTTLCEDKKSQNVPDYKANSKFYTKLSLIKKSGIIALSEDDLNFLSKIEIEKYNSLINGLDYRDLENKSHFFEDNVFRYYNANTIIDGNIFGELGIARNKQRSATVVCVENTHLAYLTASDYRKILLEIERININRLADFFADNFLKDYSRDGLMKIAYLFKKKKIHYGYSFFNEGEETSECYFIKKGSVQVIFCFFN